MAEWHSKIPVMQYEVPLMVEVNTRASAQRIRNGARRRSRVDTGQMRDGWKTRKAEGEGGYAYEVYNEVPHVVFNEFGTTRLPAQPMLGPAVLDEEGNYIASFKTVFPR